MYLSQGITGGADKSIPQYEKQPPNYASFLQHLLDVRNLVKISLENCLWCKLKNCYIDWSRLNHAGVIKRC